MSRFEEKQGPGPATADGQAQEPEPQLLTRPVDTQDDDRWTRSSRRERFAAMGLGAAWVARLRRPREAVPERELESPGTRDGNPEPVVLARTPGRLPVLRRRWKRPLWVAAVCLPLVALTALAVVLDLRHALHASLPQLDGDIHIAGLQAPVTVTRDAQGVPAITAANLDDLLFAQGYVTASDRLWQMDGLRRHAAGELAEILGPGLVEHDRRQRYLQIRAAADRAVAALPAVQKAQLEAYAHGVNAFIESHRGSLPMEFRLLAYKPAPWSPRDTLLVSLAMYQDLSTGFPQKLNREALSAHLPPALLPDLYPVGSWRDLPPAAQSRNITAPHEVEQIPLDPSQSRMKGPLQKPWEDAAKPDDLLAVSDGLAGGARCEGCRPGSNNWAVSGSHTASGGALLSNDMHLNLGIPDVWYEASLHVDLLAAGAQVVTGTPGDRLDVVGFTLPGVPFVLVGRNAHVAWGLTNLGGDVQDLRVEHLRGTGENTEYQRPDSTWALANHRSERIRVRGGRDVTLDVLTTMHSLGNGSMETPVISPLYPTEHRALSLAWTAYDPATVTSPFLAINTAKDGATLVASFAGFGGPTLNLVWADDHNHIGYHAVGRIPVRGPAIQHPRIVETPLPMNAAPGTLPPDEGDQPATEPSSTEESGAGADGPQAMLAEGPHMILSAFHPARRRQALPHARTARPKVAQSRRGRHRAARARALALVPSAPVETAPPPTPPPLNYTVGSPLSPVPVDALDGSQAWSGYIGYGDLPAVMDPANGLLATANSRITPDDYPWAIATDWVDPFRTEWIVHLLNGRNGLTPADMLRTETDVHSDVDQAIGHRLAYALDHASAKTLGSDARRLKQAADLLRDFDGNMTASSPTAAIVSAVRTQLWSALLIPQVLAHEGNAVTASQAGLVALLYTSNERTTALEVILQNQPARWLPPPYTRWSDFLAAVTKNALKAGHAPGDLRQWQYGKLHTVEIAHPLIGDQRLLSDLLGIRGSTGAHPAPGDATTIKQMGAHFGPSERFTADLASPTAAFGNITTGESENGQSPWYLDQFQPWLAGTTFALPLSGAGSVHTLRLLPQ